MTKALLVSVIIPCYNHAHFLDAAIESALSQTCEPVEVVVVDDGSSDDTARVVARYPAVRYVWQENQGLAAARNAGLDKSHGDLLVFLDADDRLLPEALEAGRRCIEAHPSCGFVYGAYRWIKEDGSFFDEGWAATRIYDDHYAEMLRRNYIAMHGTVMYRREALVGAGGFDASLEACEDYDAYLRLSRVFPVCSHPAPVAEYRMHGSNMSNDPALMLSTSLEVLRAQHAHVRGDAHLQQAYEEGLVFWKECYAHQLADRINEQWRSGAYTEAVHDAAVLLRYAPDWFVRHAMRQARAWSFRVLKRLLPPSVQRRLRAVRRGPGYRPDVGRVRMGDLRRLTPISHDFGHERGRPIDRYYIERFLENHAHDIRGRILEVKDSAYTRRFGGERVTQSDVLDIDAHNPEATIVADLAGANDLPSDAFDGIILTQTLHLIYDVSAAADTLFRILKPGGALLATVPGITKVQPEWHWSFTAASVQRLFEEAFGSDRISVQAHGNVLAAQAFLQGLAVEDLHQEELDYFDAEYLVTITLHAVKGEPPPSQAGTEEAEAATGHAAAAHATDPEAAP